MFTDILYYKVTMDHRCKMILGKVLVKKKSGQGYCPSKYLPKNPPGPAFIISAPTILSAVRVQHGFLIPWFLIKGRATRKFNFGTIFLLFSSFDE